jgi:molybdopterin-guanine dinucleotide biosynthesis protein B
LHEVAARLARADIVIVEGMKRAPIPKIEVRRTGQGDGPPLAGHDGTVFAIASDRPAEHAPVPAFTLNDIEGLAQAVVAARAAARAHP